MFSLNDLDYYLPSELIAERPADVRDASRLLVIDRSASNFTDHRFTDITGYFSAGDCIIFNRTQVVKARLIAVDQKNRETEILLVEMSERASVSSEWNAMIKRSRRYKPGAGLKTGGYTLTVGGYLDDGMRRIRFDRPVSYDDINRIGIMPIPPYIAKRREELNQPLYQPQDDEWYQPVVADQSGSVAAPTASLHFTAEILEKLRNKGVHIGYVTLHVGPGTFRAIEEDVENFKIHREWISVPADTLRMIENTRNAGGKAFAVGTTSTRALETAMNRRGECSDPEIAYEGYTDLFITPGYRFQAVDALITNFHMPRSTLLLLVYAFAGKDLIRDAYAYAIREKYRFYSYGDAMLIL